MMDEAGLNCDADKIGGARRPEFGFDLATIVRRRLIANANRIGDLWQSTTLGQQAEDLKIA
jgi:hypothetical protein